MAEALPMKLVDVFSSPLGMMVLVLALLGIAGTVVWAFWDRSRPGHTSAASHVPTKPTAPPLLNPEIMRPAAQSNLTSGGDGILRNILIGILGIVVLIIGGQFIIGKTAEEAGQSTANNESPAGNSSTPSGSTGQVDNDDLVECEPGPAWTTRSEDSQVYLGVERERIKSYTICSTRRSARFDVIDFKTADDGETVMYPVWHPVDLPVLGTKGVSYEFKDGEYKIAGGDYYYKTQFALSKDEFDLVPGADTKLSDYDLFIAVGMAGWEIEGGVADQRAANRGFHIARYVLEEIRGEQEANDCGSAAVVYALSVGQFQPGGTTAAAEVVPEAILKQAGKTEPVGQLTRQSAPVLFGVKYLQTNPKVPMNESLKDRRTRVEGMHRELIADFLRSQGSTIAGFNLREFETPQTLFVEPACSRPAIQ